jgi:hypothetical protein
VTFPWCYDGLHSLEWCNSPASLGKEKRSMKSPHSEATPNFLYRCAGPNCAALKQNTQRWWLMWTSFGDFNRPVLYLCSWDEEIASREGALYVCGELCAQRLQSQFMGNILEGEMRRVAG